MAIKITQLPAVTTSAGSDTKEVVQGGLSKKVTLDQDTTYIKANIATAPYVLGDLFYAGSTSSPSRLADVATGNALISGGVGVAPSYGKITYGHMQTESASTLLGNPTGAGGAVSEISLGAGLGFDGTTLVATGVTNTLQDVYSNGTGGAKGTIVQTLDGLNPMAFFATNIGSTQIPLALVNFVNPNSDALFPWRFDFRAPTAPSTNLKSYAAIETNPEDSSDSTTNGSLILYVNSYTNDTVAFKISGQNQLTSSFFPMQIQNGASVYQSTYYVTTDITYDGTQTGKVLLSDDAGIHLINIPASYFSTNADDSFTAQTQSTYPMIAQVSGGASINGSTNPTTIPVNTRATFQLVDPVSKSWVMTANASSNDNDVNGLTIDSTTGTSAASVTSSRSILINDIATLTGRIDFTASATTALFYIIPPFSVTFTGSHQADGVATITKVSGGAINDGSMVSMVSVAPNKILIIANLTDNSSDYALYLSLQYTVVN